MRWIAFGALGSVFATAPACYLAHDPAYDHPCAIEHASWSHSPVSPMVHGPLSLAVDSSAALHILHTGNSLTYVTGRDGNWETEFITAWGGWPFYPDLALSPDGALHACYFMSDWAYSLVHSTHETDGWTGEGSPGLDLYGAYFAPGAYAIDDNGDMRAVYSQRGEIRYLRRTADAGGDDLWNPDVVGSGDHGVMTLDEAGVAQIAYVDGTTLRHGVRLDDGWHIDDVDSIRTPSSETFIDIAVSAEGVVHIVYSDQDKLRHAHGSADQWSLATIEGALPSPRSLSNPPPTFSVTMDSTGTPHMAFVSGNDRALHFTSFRGGRWDGATLEPTGIDSLALAIDSTNAPHIVYVADTMLSHATLTTRTCDH